jgi:hypothetical protein
VAFQCNIERFDTHAAATDGLPTAPQGTPIRISGWVLDSGGGTIPRRIFGTVDGTIMVHATVTPWNDTRVGFDISVVTRDLLPRQHVLSIIAEDTSGELWCVEQRAFVVTGPEPSQAFPRIIVCGAPKSGSTYTWLVLTKYFGTQELTPDALFRGTQPILDTWALERLRGRGYVGHMHLFPNSLNLRAIADESIVPIVLWRNLGDAIVSNDDHFRRLHEITPEEEGERYFAMDPQDRYAFLIRFRLGEYISFYLGWQRAGFPIYRYEDMVRDEAAYFDRIIAHIEGTTDSQRLQAAQAAATAESRSRQNRNVGAIGRSAVLFSETTKALLEDALSHYYQPLDELLAELPWHR